MSLPLSDPAHPMLHRILRPQWEDIQQSWVLLYPEGTVTLNDSVAAILQHCNGVHTLDMLIDDLQSAFGAQDIAPGVHILVKYTFERGWFA